MSETTQIILGFLFLAVLFILTRIMIGRKMQNTAKAIMSELKRRGATDPASAVSLGYEKSDWLKIGLRDYRPKALEALINHGIVVKTSSGGYYLAREILPQ